MAYGSLDKKGRHRKSRQRIRYETARIRYDEVEMIRPDKGKKSGIDARNRTQHRASKSR